MGGSENAVKPGLTAVVDIVCPDDLTMPKQWQKADGASGVLNQYISNVILQGDSDEHDYPEGLDGEFDDSGMCVAQSLHGPRRRRTPRTGCGIHK